MKTCFVCGDERCVLWLVMWGVSCAVPYISGCVVCFCMYVCVMCAQACVEWSWCFFFFFLLGGIWCFVVGYGGFSVVSVCRFSLQWVFEGCALWWCVWWWCVWCWCGCSLCAVLVPWSCVWSVENMCVL